LILDKILVQQRKFDFLLKNLATPIKNIKLILNIILLRVQSTAHCVQKRQQMHENENFFVYFLSEKGQQFIYAIGGTKKRITFFYT
jgi:hypothetical protein